MKRRNFSNLLIGVGLGIGGLVASLSALAEKGPVEGTHYVRLSQPAPTSAPGKIEVVEFFWYGCPHCSTFEPMLEAWSKKLPADVLFRRVPVAFRDAYIPHQKIYYSLESMGKIDAMHKRVFYAIHSDRAKLDKPEEIADFMAKNGIDRTKFLETYNSFSVQTKARQATMLADGYKIDGVPALGIQGRYFTSGGLAGSAENSLVVTDYLIQRVRKSN